MDVSYSITPEIGKRICITTFWNNISVNFHFGMTVLWDKVWLTRERNQWQNLV